MKINITTSCLNYDQPRPREGNKKKWPYCHQQGEMGEAEPSRLRKMGGEWTTSHWKEDKKTKSKQKSKDQDTNQAVKNLDKRNDQHRIKKKFPLTKRGKRKKKGEQEHHIETTKGLRKWNLEERH